MVVRTVFCAADVRKSPFGALLLLRDPPHPHPRSSKRRAFKEAQEAAANPAPLQAKVDVKNFVKIGRPGYKGDFPTPEQPRLEF